MTKQELEALERARPLCSARLDAALVEIWDILEREGIPPQEIGPRVAGLMVSCGAKLGQNMQQTRQEWLASCARLWEAVELADQVEKSGVEA